VQGVSSIRVRGVRGVLARGDTRVVAAALSQA
jgi:hypothetical protein